MSKLEFLKEKLQPGQVYQRKGLARWSNAIDRHLKQLVDDGTLKKLSHGLYFYPKKTAFGDAPPDEKILIKAFLNDDRFLITSPNAYNTLGVGAAEERSSLLEAVMEKVHLFDRADLVDAARAYGSVATKKFFTEILGEDSIYYGA